LHFTKIKKWDICAPNAILSNLGGKLLSREGEKIDYADVKQPWTVGFIAALNNFEYFFESFKTKPNVSK
jgi:3'-phosphoadenosine 5'-phosphosulfate (PAPS) 3'-phosphatase